MSWCSVGFKHCGQWHSEGFSMVNSRLWARVSLKGLGAKGFGQSPLVSQFSLGLCGSGV